MPRPRPACRFLLGWSLALLLTLPAFGQGLSAAPPGTVEGRAPLTGKDPSSARALALEQAFRNRVMAEVASRLPEKVRREKQAELESAIYSHSLDFISRYQIVAEQPQADEYVVYLELEVAGALLNDALTKAGFLQSVKSPRVFLLVLEQGPAGQTQSWWKNPPAGPVKPSHIEQALKQELASHGYSVIEPQPGGPRITPERVTNPGSERDQVLRQLQKDFQADLLLVGKASTHAPEGRPATQAEVSLAGVNLENQETLFRLERTAESAQTGEPGAGQALTQAAQDLAPELLQRLKALRGHHLQLEISASGDVIVAERAAEPSAAAPSGPGARAALTPRKFTKYAVTLDEFNERIVGGKSCHQARLRGHLPESIRLPASVALPFGVFEKVLG